MNKLFLILVGMSLSFTAVSAVSATDVKIAYVDLQKALKETKAGKSARASLEKIFNKKKSEFQKVEKDLKSKQEDLQKKAMVLSDEVRSQKQMDLQKDMIEYQKKVSESQQELQKKEQALTKPILEGLQKAITRIATRDKYTMILEKSQQGIVWAEKGLDLTDELIKEYEKK